MKTKENKVPTVVAQFLLELLPYPINRVYQLVAKLKFPTSSLRKLKAELQRRRPKGEDDTAELFLLAALQIKDFPLKSASQTLGVLHKNLGVMLAGRNGKVLLDAFPLPGDLYPNSDPASVALRKKLQECLDAFDSALPSSLIERRRCYLQNVHDAVRVNDALRSVGMEPPLDICSYGGLFGYAECIANGGSPSECHATYVRAVYACRRERGPRIR